MKLLNKNSEEQSTDLINLYLESKKQWNERYGSYIDRERKWQKISFISLALTCLFAIGFIILSTQTKLVPYVVEVDRQGRTYEVIQAEKIRVPDERIIKANLFQFINDLRMITIDSILQKLAITRVFSFVKDDSAAKKYILSYYQDNPPAKRASEAIVQVEVVQILPLSENTWKIDWIETTTTNEGILKSRISYSATVNIVIGGEVNTNTILYNPAGLYILDINIQKDFFEKDKNKVN